MQSYSILCIIFLTWAISAFAQSEFEKKIKQKRMPNFQLKSIDGKSINFKELVGKPVMINFWSTTCGPCIKEMPELNQLKEQFEKDVIFLAFTPETAQQVHKIIQNIHLIS